MRVYGPPAAVPAGLTVRAVTRRAFPAAAPFGAEHRARYATWLADLGAGPGPDLSGQSYAGMAAAVLPAAEVDLLVLAFAGHDIEPGRATATYLSHRCPGRPLALAVCDQGAAAPFTALRLIRDHGAESALLVVVEQAGLPYPAPVPAGHTAVGVHLARGGTTGVEQYPDVDPADVPAVLAAAVDPGATLITATDPGRPVTGLWWALADAPAGPVVLGGYEPATRRLCVATLGIARPPRIVSPRSPAGQAVPA
jgi:hypothetical protein